jgi:hypothetical protein
MKVNIEKFRYITLVSLGNPKTEAKPISGHPITAIPVLGNSEK